MRTPTGSSSYEIVGLADNQQENGTVLFVPLATLRSTNPAWARAGYWVKTATSQRDEIDRTTTRIEDALTTAGLEVGTEIPYVAARDEEARNRTITTTITVLGFLIIALSMVGMVGAITSSVLERTREVGILRCIGARARDVRSIFATEGLALALCGWLLGVPLGFALDHLLVWWIERGSRST